MKEQETTQGRKRRDWIIILIILLIGFLCVILAGEQAVRFSPRWKLDTNMRSNLDPDSDFLTNRPVNYYEPVDPSILTQQIRINNFLTPGALFEINTSQPSSGITNTPVATNTPAPTLLTSPTAVNSTNTPIAAIPSSTNTSVYFPPSPPTNTPKPPPPPTNTPLPIADLAITKTDLNSSYIPGGTVTYTITVANNGPRDINGAVVTDTFDTSRLNNITWTCAYAGGASSTCSGSGNINDTAYLPNGATITYSVATNVSGSATGNLVNTASVSLPAGYTDPVPGNNAATDTDTVTTVIADLSITKDDGSATYTPGGSISYTIVVSNPSTSTTDVTGATVADTFDATRLNTINWTCSASVGASCTASGFGNISDNTVNLPIGGTVTYTVAAKINPTATGDLVNTATVSAPAGVYDPGTINNSYTDTDTAAPSADLSITVTDKSSSYVANALKLLPNTPPYAYTITVTNAGPSNVTGATVSNVFSNGNVTSNIGWTCTASAGASCSAALGLGNLNNQSVNLNSGSSVTFYLAVEIVSSPSGDLVNDVAVTAPVGVTDPGPGLNSATDTDTLIVSSGTTYGDVGTDKDSIVQILPPGTVVVLSLSSPITVNNAAPHAGPEIVYYELPVTNPPNPVNGIMMDQVILQISDGSNWYTILNWGNGSADTNTNIAVPLPAPNPTNCNNESDNCAIDGTLLYNSSGIAINLDSVVPNGTYPYIRIISPPPPTPLTPESGDGVEVDAIYVVP